MGKELMIKRLKIEKLFGIYNVNIPFKSNINIFIGENGVGKTTILNILNYVISGYSEGLSSIDFNTIEVLLGDNEKITINKKDLINYISNKFDGKIRRYYIEENAPLLEKRIAMEIMKAIDNNEVPNKEHILDRISWRYRRHVSRSYIEDVYDSIFNDEKAEKILENSWEYQVYNHMKKWGDVIYLPTYRRIEEDFNDYMDSSSDREHYMGNRTRKNLSYMQFGMDDVQKSIDKTCNDLRNNTNEGFKGMTTNLLTNYISSVERKLKLNKKDYDNIDSKKLEIVFSRLADKIDNELTKKIINMMGDNSLVDRTYFFSIISELINIYEKNKQIDDKLEGFEKVCNNYMVNKRVNYDKFKIECNVIQKNSQKIIDLKNLSSGEKQIMSLFSKLYLDSEKNNIILFDEPELSLSVLWQNRLIPDIIDSERCSFLCMVTHSPFIFENEYVANVIDIEKYISLVE